MIRRGLVVYGLVLLFSGLAPIVSAQVGAFEGVVVYKMIGTGENMEMTQMYKGTKSRTELSSKGQSGAMIMDAATGTMTTLIAPQKMYMVMDFRKMGEALQGLTGGRGDAGKAAAGQAPSIKATGRTEMVAGYTCEWYVMGEKGESEVCAAKGIGIFMFGQSPMGRGSSSMGSLAALGSNAELMKTFKDGFFPLKMAQVKGGKTQVVMEATKVEKKSLDASLFVPPPDYTEMKMPSFGR
jgi:hypothetical protein